MMIVNVRSCCFYPESSLSLCQLMNYELLIEYIQGHKSIIGLAYFLVLFAKNMFNIISFQEDWSICPSECRCTWSGGKRTAECQVREIILRSFLAFPVVSGRGNM